MASDVFKVRKHPEKGYKTMVRIAMALPAEICRDAMICSISEASFSPLIKITGHTEENSTS